MYSRSKQSHKPLEAVKHFTKETTVDLAEMQTIEYLIASTAAIIVSSKYFDFVGNTTMEDPSKDMIANTEIIVTIVANQFLESMGFIVDLVEGY